MGFLGLRGLLATILCVVMVFAVPLPAAWGLKCRTFGFDCPRLPIIPPGGALPPRPLLPENAATQGSYVALGDSYSSGVGAYALPGDLAPGNRCRRTSQSFVHSVASTFGFAGGVKFHACAGARTEHLFRAKSGEPPQVERVDADTSLITLSIGGNDLGFTRILSGCIVRVPWSSGCERQEVVLAARRPALRMTLTGIVQRLVERAPRARIVLLGYPRLFGEAQGTAFDNLSVTDQRWLNAKGEELNELIREVAAAADAAIVAGGGAGSVEFIDLYRTFTDHEVGSGAPFVHGLEVELKGFKVEFQSYHPNAAGYAAIAERLAVQIRRGPGRDLNQWRPAG